jgi:DNA-binding MarR family transcriptional regulator
MPTKITTADYRALAELRYQIRHFLHDGDVAARQCGLEPQQYYLLLALRGIPEGIEATVRTLAERLALKHNSAVELIDRMEKHGYVQRMRSSGDRRYAVVSLLPGGRILLEKVAQKRITELRDGGTVLVNAIDALLGNKRRPRRRAASSDNQRAKRS